ncbi:septal ring lytic transglycosylase RlpA family protein [Methylibium sp. Pch-M]|uniref:septal ring lytic transglycosylase RlpA family protein n=1 Tax=Methylibium sp. Pch-M TaxID=2082386 RepID=UPI00268B355F|nr:septal ring lytic transglycosylase RlpA family protein [Methylibium sp. Pch-M]
MVNCIRIAPPSPLGHGLRLILVLAAAMLVVGCGTVRLPGGTPPPAPSVEPEASPAPLPEPPQTRTPRVAKRAPAPPVDAVPRVERIRQGAPNHPYVIRGESYEPDDTDVPWFETGVASWYGEPFHGRRTANGEVYDMHGMTAAHKTMPLPSYAVVRNRVNGRQVVVRVNDRGPFIDGRVIDLSFAAARKLGIRGLGEVEVRRLTHDEIRAGSWKKLPQTMAVGEDRAKLE